MFYYDQETKNISLSNTWENEKIISDVIKSKVNNPIDSGIDYEKYKIVDGMELTEEQLSFLKYINENTMYRVAI